MLKTFTVLTEIVSVVVTLAAMYAAVRFGLGLHLGDLVKMVQSHKTKNVGDRAKSQYDKVNQQASNDNAAGTGEKSANGKANDAVKPEPPKPEPPEKMA